MSEPALGILHLQRLISTFYIKNANKLVTISPLVDLVLLTPRLTIRTKNISILKYGRPAKITHNIKRLKKNLASGYYNSRIYGILFRFFFL